MLRLGFHCLITCWQVYVLYCLSQLKLEDIDNEFIKTMAKLNLRFFTHWIFLAQTTFFFISIFLDVLRLTKTWSKLGGSLQKWSSYFLFSVIIPLTFIVAIAFWTVFLYDRELVFPISLAKYVADWMNHAVHTIIVANVVVEVLLVHHKLPKTSLSVIMLSVFLVVYSYVVIETHISMGVWIYPIIDHLSSMGIIVMLTGCLVMDFLLLFAARAANRLIWGDIEKEDKE